MRSESPNSEQEPTARSLRELLAAQRQIRYA